MFCSLNLLKYFYLTISQIKSMIKSLLLISLFFLSFLLYLSQCRDCTVTQTVKMIDCVLYCWDTYQGKKDFYEFNSGMCQQRITCGPGYYNDYVNNVCIDQFGGYVLKQIGWIITVKENHVRFAQIQVLKGYFVGHKLICDDGWKSSMRTQKRNQMTLIVYLCDQKLKDGEIYPKTHGQYFFQQLTLEEKVAFIDSVFGPDSLSSILTLKMNIFLVITAIYLVLNFLACCSKAGKKTKLKFFGKKEPVEKRQKLTQSQNKEVEEYLERRKQQKMKVLGQMKQFSLQGQIKEQLELMNKIKQESQQIMRKKWAKRLQKKQEQKQKAQQKENLKDQENLKKQEKEKKKPLEILSFLRPKKKQQKQSLPVESKIKQSSVKMKNSSVMSTKMKQKSKNQFPK